MIQSKDTHLSSRQDDDITLSKSDLAISFTLKSFISVVDDSDLISQELERFISSDDSD